MLPLKDENPTKRIPFVTVALIVVNCAVFFYEYSLGSRGLQEFTFKYGLIPAELFAGRDLMPEGYAYLATSPYVNIFSSMFLHGGLMHLGGNMLYLWIFGNNIEDVLGHVWFVVFYLGAGVAAALSFAVLDPHSEVPMVGASGAISGVLGAYVLRFPQARVVTLVWLLYFIRIVRVPALVLLGFWFILQVVNGSSSLGASQGGGVAWFAHVGGFVFGALVFIVLRKFPGKRAND